MAARTVKTHGTGAGTVRNVVLATLVQVGKAAAAAASAGESTAAAGAAQNTAAPLRIHSHCTNQLGIRAAVTKEALDGGDADTECFAACGLGTV